MICIESESGFSAAAIFSEWGSRMPSYQPVEALLRGLSILRHISAAGPLSVGDIHRALGINKATIVRMIETLIAAGYVARDEKSAVYSVTGKALELSAGYDASHMIELASAPILEELQKQIGWPSDVAILDGCDMIVAATSRGQGRMFFNRKRGYRAPLLGTSLGRAYLAFAHPRERAKLLQLIAEYPDPWNEAARQGNAEPGLDKIREDHFATIDPVYAAREYDDLVSTLGIPILGNGYSIGALNVMYLREAMKQDEAIKKLLPPLRDAADRIAAKIAASP